MRNHEFFAACLEKEIPAFLKVFRAVPADKLDYKPHEKNSSAGALSRQMAIEIDCLANMFDSGVADYKSGGGPESIDDITDVFERGAKACVEKARAADDERWKGPAKFVFDGHTAWETTAADMAWGFLFDLIHHRGQLSVYLRPMGSKVPAIYGPSADDPGQ